MVVRQAQLIDFARPLPQKENIPAVENDMRNQFAAIAPEEMNRDPARLRLGRIKYLRRSEEHTSELQSLMRISYAVFCLKKTKTKTDYNYPYSTTRTLLHHTTH